MRVFKNRWFQKFARKENISDALLLEAIERAERGLVDADLGGGVIKLRIAREGSGRAGGYRMIVLFKQEYRAFFVYGFAKSERANIDSSDEALFKEMAKKLLALSDSQIAELLRGGGFLEVCDGKTV